MLPSIGGKEQPIALRFMRPCINKMLLFHALLRFHAYLYFSCVPTTCISVSCVDVHAVLLKCSLRSNGVKPFSTSYKLEEGTFIYECTTFQENNFYLEVLVKFFLFLKWGSIPLEIGNQLSFISELSPFFVLNKLRTRIIYPYPSCKRRRQSFLIASFYCSIRIVLHNLCITRHVILSIPKRYVTL